MTRDQFKRMFPLAPDSFIERNRSLWTLAEPGVVSATAEIKPEKLEQVRRLGLQPSTEESKLNQTEKRYLGWLRAQGDLWIGIQCFTLRLGHDCRYTPDFWALDAQGLRAIDTKGKHTWEDSIIKLRLAARLFPFFRFIKAVERNGAWMHKEFKP